MRRVLRKGDQTLTLENEDDELRVAHPDGEAETIDAFAERGMPADILLAQMEAEYLADGWSIVLPDDLLAQVEAAQDVQLTGRLRAFYESGEWKSYEGRTSQSLGCEVSFVSPYSIDMFLEEFYDADADAMLTMVCMCSRTSDGYTEEQAWIGADPREGDGPIYSLFTSNAYEEAFPDLDAFLADLSA